MATATTLVTGRLVDATGTAIANEYVYFRLKTSGADKDVTPEEVYALNSVETQTDASGDISVSLWCNGDSDVPSVYEITTKNRRLTPVGVIIPTAASGGTIDIATLIADHQAAGSSTQQDTTFESAKQYTDTLAADPTANASFSKSAWLVDLNVEDGADVTDVTNVTAAGAVMDSEVSSLSGVKTLTVPDSTTISTFGATLVDDLSAAAARTTLGIGTGGTGVIGTDVQAWDAQLDDIAALAVTDGNFVVGNGTNWVAESGATARASLGVSIGSQVQAWNDNLDDLAALTPTGEGIIRGNGTDWVVATNFRVDAGTAGSGTEMGTGTANGFLAVAEGDASVASGTASHAEGANTLASGQWSHAEGNSTTASGSWSHAEGADTQATNDYAHVEGKNSIASGSASHAEGWQTTSSAFVTHTEGYLSEATADYSAATGRRAKAIHQGARVEADSQDADVSSTTTDQFTARFQNGYEFKGGRAKFDGGVATSTTSVTATTYTSLITDSVILADDDTAGAAITITLLAAATAGDGFELTIKKAGSTASVIIDGNGTETIDGGLTATLTAQYEAITIISNGTNWYVI